MYSLIIRSDDVHQRSDQILILLNFISNHVFGIHLMNHNNRRVVEKEYSDFLLQNSRDIILNFSWWLISYGIISCLNEVHFDESSSGSEERAVMHEILIVPIIRRNVAFSA